MPKVITKQEQKEENFDAIAPQKQTPIMVTTNGGQTKVRLGPLGVFFLLLFVVTATGAVWFFVKYSNLQAQLTQVEEDSNVVQIRNDDGTSLLDKINQHILLPHDQNPKVTTIENSEELKKQESYFEYAQDGDALVEFDSLEIIYNPVADVIVNARSRGTVAGTETRAVQGAITIEIRNGAGVAGLAGKTAETLKGLKEYIVQSVGNAVKTDYPKTLVVNLSGKDVSGLEKQFNTKAVRDLPQGEQSSNADVVIILGKS